MFEMNGFISYSHKDEVMLQNLKKHLAQLVRDGFIKTWMDEMIPAGEVISNQINSALERSRLFLALLSPDYIASNYCYEEEFQRALEMAKQEKIVIIPIIIEPCDWLNTPFKDFKALPKDGKAISEWHNINTAFLDVISGLRNLLKYGEGSAVASSEKKTTLTNYKIQKQFDSIQRIEFAEKSFKEITNILEGYINEINGVDNIFSKVIHKSDLKFEALMVNRNIVNAEVGILVTLTDNLPTIIGKGSNKEAKSQRYIKYLIIDQHRKDKGDLFELFSDGYNLLWMQVNDLFRQQALYFGGSHTEATPIDSSQIAKNIWDNMIGEIGISI